MKKIIGLIFTLIMMCALCVTASAGHWYTMHDLNYMMDNGDYNSIVMEQIFNSGDKVGFEDVNNPNEKVYISYHKGYFAGYGDAAINELNQDDLFEFVYSLRYEPNVVEVHTAYEGNREDRLSFNHKYTYTDANGYNGFKEIMMFKNVEDLYLVEYYNDADKYDNDITKNFLHQYYYFGARRDGDESAPVQEEEPDPIRIVVDGNEIISDVQPQIIDDRTLVPVRTVAGGLGYEVGWDGSTRTVILEKDKTNLKIDIGHNIIRKQYVEYDRESGIDVVKNEQVEADVPAQIIDDRTYLPVRAVSEALGCKVDWDGRSRTVSITTVKTEEPEITTVYIAETGNEFHKKRNCVKLPNNSGTGMPYDFAVGQGRTKCELCWD